MEYFNFDRFLSVQIKMILVYKNYQSTHVCMQLDVPFFTYFTQK